MDEIEVEFVQMHGFSQQLDAIGEPDLIIAIEDALMKDPDAGVLLKGGIRKVRIASAVRGVGKRGGYRVWHYSFRRGQTIYLLWVMDKRVAQNISKERVNLLLAGLAPLLQRRLA